MIIRFCPFCKKEHSLLSEGSQAIQYLSGQKTAHYKCLITGRVYEETLICNI